MNESAAHLGPTCSFNSPPLKKLIHFFFLRSFRFTAQLSVSIEIPHTPPTPHVPPALHSCPQYQHSRQRGALGTMGGPTLTRHSHPESVVYVRVRSWWCPCCGRVPKVCRHGSTVTASYRRVSLPPNPRCSM